MIFTRTLVADHLSPVRAYAALRDAAEGGASFLFESVVGGERWGRFSVAGYRPRHEAVLTPGGWALSGAVGAGPLAGARDPLTAAGPLFRPEAPASEHPAARLARARFGFCAWELVHAFAKVPGWGDAAGT